MLFRSAWTFVPAAGGALADLGADVIKVEPPAGDPQRGLLNILALSTGTDSANPFVACDICVPHEDGRPRQHRAKRRHPRRAVVHVLGPGARP